MASSVRAACEPILATLSHHKVAAISHFKIAWQQHQAVAPDPTKILQLAKKFAACYRNLTKFRFRDKD